MTTAKTELEEQLRSAIQEALAPRLAVAKTRQEATRLTATALFFDHGIYPSAKVVHSYTGRGSLTDIQRDLHAFWSDLRERGKVKLDVPGMPAELAAAFAVALATTWEHAGTLAKAEFDGERAVADREIAGAQEQAQAAAQHLAFAKQQLETTEQRLEQEREKVAQVSAQAARLEAELAATAAELEAANRRYEAEAKARTEAETRFSRDLEQLRAERERDALMFDGEIKFAKMQIEEARETERRARERFTNELGAARVEAGAFRQRASSAEDARSALAAEVARLQVEIAKRQAAGKDVVRRPRHRASAQTGLRGRKRR